MAAVAEGATVAPAAEGGGATGGAVSPMDTASVMFSGAAGDGIFSTDVSFDPQPANSTAERAKTDKFIPVF